MDITAIIGIGIIGTVLAVTLKTYRPEFSLFAALATGMAIIAMVLPQIQTVISEISRLCTVSKIGSDYFKVIAKVIGTAYLTQFSAEIAKDAGEGAIAKKIEFAGKAVILTVTLPIIKNLMNIIFETLTDF